MTLLFCSISPWKVRSYLLFMAGPKSVLEMVHILQAEIAEESNITTSFGEKRFVYLQTHLLM